jgi:hypothetical protein
VSSLVAASHLCGGSIARATADHARHRSAWLAGRCVEAAQRRALRAVGAVVETVEGVNLLPRGGQHDPLIPHRLRRLEPAPVPRTVPELVQCRERASAAHRADGLA